jgi:hypothetical protein
MNWRSVPLVIDVVTHLRDQGFYLASLRWLVIRSPNHYRAIPKIAGTPVDLCDCEFL